MIPGPLRLARDAIDFFSGRRPEVRNRVKFFLISPIYDGFYRWLRLAEIQDAPHTGHQSPLDRPVRTVRGRPSIGWLVDLYLRLGEPAHARAVLGDGLARLLRRAGFAVEREGPRGAAPMQLLVARPSSR